MAEQQPALLTPVVRWPVAAVAGIALCLAVLSVTIAGVFREAAPDRAMAVAPFDARARAAAAVAALGQGRGRANGLQALRLARSAYLTDATAIAAYTAAAGGLELTGRSREAMRLVEFSERLSRRHVPTQLALIELSVQREDIARALLHYDTIFRTSERTKPLLYPLLTNAVNERPIADELNRRLRLRPNWGQQFLAFLIGASENPDALYRVHRGVLDPGNDKDRELGLQLLRRLSDAGRFQMVWALYRELARSSEIAPLRNGSFDPRDGWPPVDWQFAEEPALAPERVPLESGSGFALHLPSGPGADGVVARQLLGLEGGAYELRAMVGDLPTDELRRPFLRVGCADRGADWSQDLALPQAPSEGAPLVRRITIPSGCRNQWLAIHARGGLDDALDQSPWISALSLRRL